MENLCDDLEELMGNESGLMDYEYEMSYRLDILRAIRHDLSQDQLSYMLMTFGFTRKDLEKDGIIREPIA